MEVCREYAPDRTELSDGHGVSCWLEHEYAPEVDFDASSVKVVRKSKETGGEDEVNSGETVLEVKELSRYFHVGYGQMLHAVDRVSFTVSKGETLGLVGESGCGKSTTGRCITKLLKPTSGEILYKGRNIFEMTAEGGKLYRQKMQMIFQNPYSSLNPRMTVGEIVGEGMKLHSLYPQEEIGKKVEELLNRVGLGREHMSRFSHEFSGGQRQRIGIARALSVRPEFIVCDEPVSALDVSIQAQVINMLKDLQRELGLTLLFIAHDLSVVRYISDRIAVMYLGELVEEASTEELFKNPSHPYTQMLLSAIPVPDPERAREKRRIEIRGEIPSPINPGIGCRFAERCPRATEQCRSVNPVRRKIGEGHYAACHLL
ncbi:MAG: ABC transporter ATP-binding protein [Lachnospiraceae bacterium]|nr:ABC transporter ATP-binding protein [Lachnospiraceae bacterium]